MDFRYELGVSAISLASVTAATANTNNKDVNKMNSIAPPRNHQAIKRGQDVLLSPSPSSVVDESMPLVDQQQDKGYSTPLPLTKRQRIDDNVYGGQLPTTFTTNKQQNDADISLNVIMEGGSITPETSQHRKSMASSAARGPTTVTMECEGQYEWWKVPPTAPQLSPTRTMNSKPKDNSGVVGCFVCQRFFVPPPVEHVTTTATNTATLLNYFPVKKQSNPGQPPCTAKQQQQQPPTQQNATKSPCKCTFCERNTCNQCMRQCEQCQHSFCKLCSTTNYATDGHLENTLCLDCASMLDLQQSNSQMMMEEG